MNVQRLNRDARTRIAAVFSLTYNGNDSVEVYIEDKSETVTFTGLATHIEGAGNAVTLDPGQSVAVGLRIDTTGTIPKLSEFKLNARIADANGDIPVTIEQPAPGFVEVGTPSVTQTRR